METLQAEISGYFEDILTSYLNQELSVLYLNSGAYSKADSLLDMCLTCFAREPGQHAWDISDCYAQKAFVSLQKRQYLKAEQYLHLSQESGPFLWEAQALWARLLYETGQTDRIREHVIKMYEIYPDSVSIFEACGKYLAQSGSPKDGMLCFLHADSLKRDFDSPDYLCHLGGLYLLSKEQEKAKLHYERCLYLSPCHIPCLTRLVNTYCEMEKYDDALKLLRFCPIPNRFDTNELMRLRFVCFSRIGELDSLSVHLPAYIDSSRALTRSMRGQDSLLIVRKLRLTEDTWRRFLDEKAANPQLKRFDIF